MVLEFEVPGTPFGKQRPQHGKGFTFTPKKTVNYENLIKLIFKDKYPDHVPTDSGVRMEVKSYYPIADSWAKKKKKLAIARLLHPKKPDWDNVGKIVSDALNQIAYHDDSQIWDARVIKFYSSIPRLEVRLEIDEVTEVDDGI